MAKTSRKSLTEAADKELKTSFSLDKFKANKGLASNVKFKEQKWIPFSPALQEALSIPGIPMGHNSMVRGKSNTGKSTMTIEVAVNAQKMGILPVLIITEMKHDWNHWKTVGFAIEDVFNTKLPVPSGLIVVILFEVLIPIFSAILVLACIVLSAANFNKSVL